MRLHFPPDLPVSGRRHDIAAAIRDHQVVVVAGETGSGKTTQLPKIAMLLGRGEGTAAGGKLIGHTQPRRIAARSVAERIAEELGTELGETVGYQVRFTDKTSKQGRVKVMTDGILLAELQHDRDLQRYDTLIIDEAHERSLNIDFILGYLRRLLPRRPDLKVVITSATIDPERFAQHFAAADGTPAPIIEVSGRTYPVEVRYRPLVEESYDDDEGEPVQRDQTEAIRDAVSELVRDTPGDVLVFLPGEREIRDTADALADLAEGPRAVRGGFDVVPLYSRLSGAEQHRVFERHTRRRVVLSTNVAETSLTVPGITGVVDTGLARISRWSTRTKVQRLPIEAISQASAQQRSGRCGRVEAGVAVRLYSQEDFESRPEFTEPEILRTSLASVILQMTSLGLGQVERFPFVEPPDTRAVRAGVQLLEELGALVPTSSTGGRGGGGRGGRGPRLTRTGRSLARLPIDPRLARMILEADRLGCLREVLVITAALSIQDPRERPVEHRAHADQLHARFRDPRSDFLTWLNLWRHLKARQAEMGSSAFRRLCREEHLNYLRVREWQDFESQLRQVAKQVGLTPGRAAGADDPVDDDAVHQALLSGLLSHIGLRDTEKRDYLGARGTRFSIFPGSGLFKKQPDLVMAAELVETSRLYARQNAAIDPVWAERLAGDLVSRQLGEPHWSSKREAAMAHERVTLYGVPLVADRLVALGARDPVHARELFIRHALVQDEWRSRHKFFETNRQLLDEAAELENRARRRDIVVDEDTLYDFYDARIPAEVVSGGHFDGWWKQERRRRPDLLTFDPDMLVHDTAGEVTGRDFPDAWQEGPLTFSLSYHFEPGSDDDGVTVDVPLATLNAVGPAPFTWNVPGLRHELVTALIRSLPKQLRVNFVPAPDFARRFLDVAPPGEEDLLDALSRQLRAMTGVHVPRDVWDLAKVPAHLRPTFRVLDEDAREVAVGKDLEALKTPLRPSFDAAVQQVASESGISATGRTRWSFGTVETSFTQSRAGHEVRAYPTLVDEGSTVGLQVVASAAEQEAHHRLGVRRLLLLAVPSPVAAMVEGLDNAAKLGLAASPYPGARALVEDCVVAAAGSLVDEARPVRDEAAFDALVVRARQELPDRAAGVLHQVLRVLAAWRPVDKALRGRVEMAALPAMNDLRAQLGRLVGPGFVADAGAEALRHYPRYLQAMLLRVERLGDLVRDRQLMDSVSPLQQAWEHRLAALPSGVPPTAPVRRVRWMLEEYRVSLWAQQLGTAQPVSDARIRKALDA
ncbi:ATP-dependent RNA helicase HrpA [Nocardioides aurantiacus]|uniref:ATP-dependent helicase HrpA n=1 Tax=Nocardioides aurantiacus TaxID=86796 RepID=A0A3N2CSG1_9ACTN|nr:ATP-dependent RNA helicase HrpA [Nocardioides aurantiacus]ROR90481.1 ATP-dependent helicase HrpA [Nocardioides aurantiacus]